MEVLAGLAAHDRVVDAGGAVGEVERRVEALVGKPQLWSVCGRSSVIQPVSTLVMRMPSVSSSSRALVRVSMFSAAFAMFVCGCPGPL